MKRYNQGFCKFGPMEQCKDGEWVRFEEHNEHSEKAIDMLYNEIDSNISFINEIEYLNNKIELYQLACLSLSVALLGVLIKAFL